jgi:hypothetical protein
MEDDYMGGHNHLLDSSRYTAGTGGGALSNFDRLIVDS